VAYQSEIELRVKVLDKELRDLEQRVKKVQNPFDVSGKRRPTAARAAAVRAQRQEADLIRRSIEDLDRLRETKAQKTQQTNLKRVRYLRDQRIQAARDVAKAEKKFAAETRKAETASAARRRAGRQKFTDVATGFGFPLLFGGGPIQALAGGIGGAAAGLGGSIAASAITAQVEAFAKEAAKVGQALNSTSGALELVREKSLFSSEAVKERALQLEEQGRVEELAALLTGELTQVIGNEGVRSLQELGKTTSETTKLWNELTTQLFALVSGPLDMFLKAVNDLLGRLTQGGKFSAFLGDLEPEQRSAAEARVKELQGRVGTGRSAAQGERMTLQAAQAQVLEEMGGLRPAGASIPVTKQDRRDFSVSGGRAKKERESRLPQLQIEIGLQERLLDLNNKIAEAKRAGNEGAAAVLEVEKIFEKTAANINEIKLEGLRKDEEAAKIRSEELKGLQQVENVNNRMRGLEAQKAESAANNIRRLENTLELSQAVTRVERERLEIEQELAKLSDQGMKGPQLAQAKSLLEQINEENAPLNSFIKKSMDSLTDLETRAVQVSQGIGNAIGGSLSSGISSLIEGSATVKEVFADMLKSIGQTLVQEGTRMIATYIAIGIAKAFAGIGGGRAPTNVPQMTQNSIVTPTGFSGQFAGMAANGGPVEGGRPYLVGERGPELFVPGQSGGVMRNEDMRSLMGRSPASGGAPSMNFSFETTSIGGTEYVSREQLESAMAVTRKQASNDGAKRGMNMTLDRMQNSPRTRTRIGLR